MATRTPNSTPFTRFSRLAFGAFAAQNTQPRKHPTERVESDDWYTPYNGPYQEPKSPFQTDKKDETWNTPVYDDLDYDDAPGLGEELTKRYGGVRENEEEEKRMRPRARTQSGVSGRTVSSGTVDPSVRRSTFSGSVWHTTPTVTNFTASAGGVGESPTAVARTPSKRNGLVGLFRSGSSKSSRSKSQPMDRSSSSVYHSHTLVAETPRPERERFGIVQDPIMEAEDDNQYFATLLHGPMQQASSAIERRPSTDSRRQRKLSKPPRPLPTATHPYANVYSPHVDTIPHSAPLSSRFPNNSTTNATHNLLTVQPLNRNRSLTSSTSTPDLRNPSRLQKRPKPNVPKGKERWLSAESWCDALLFPRPRFKVKEPVIPTRRIVSPPGSPLRENYQEDPTVGPGVSSRALNHSRSLGDLKKKANMPPSQPVPNFDRPLEPISLPAHMPNKSSRPKSFALDDLSLPSPIPSLSRVLEDGEILTHQRKKWQEQATKSFQNQRSRSFSRSRTKSLSKQAHQAEANTRPSKIDYLAARALHGNQDILPPSLSKSTRWQNSHFATDSRGTQSRSTQSRGTHSHNTSLSKTITTNTHSRGHSHSDSVGKSALKVAKAICGVEDDQMLTPPDENPKPDRGLSNLAHIGAPMHLDTRASPTPSAISDSQVGIAISTPSALRDQDQIIFPSHPYASGHMASSSFSQPRSDYAGPHPTTKLLSPDTATMSDVASRHRLPPQAMLHPYASHSPIYSEFTTQARGDSTVSPSSKMFAQFSPGIIQEILPDEIRYSPYISEASSPIPFRPRDTIVDTIGVGEALAYAAEKRVSGDSGLGTSEELTATRPDSFDHSSDYGPLSSPSGSFRIHRKPVQYEVARPSQAHMKPALDTIYSDDHVATVSSTSVPSPVRLTPPPALPIDDERNTSTDSSPDELNSEDFRDLFYRPSTIYSEPPSEVQSRPTLSRNPTWEELAPSQRTGSGLTSLARQLSQDFEEMHATFGERHDGLHFVLNENAEVGPLADRSPTEPSAVHNAFRPGSTLPEDVESSRASSFMEHSPIDEENTAHFRMGKVESLVTTPPAVSPDQRFSFTGQMAFANSPNNRVSFAGEMSMHPSSADHRRTTLSPHSVTPEDLTRRSYMTTSSLSRMSGLSDFPIPPPRDSMRPGHASLLDAYYRESNIPAPVPTSTTDQP